MKIDSEQIRKIVWLFIFALAMALLEAAVVIYLRELYYPGNIQHIFPIRLFHGSDYWVEIGREISTIVMILSVALLTERKSFSRVLASFVFIFGVWDLFYYFWLKISIGWPLSWLQWDILFLIPWAWLGPWICPALISLLFIVWGALVLLWHRDISFHPLPSILFVTGMVLDLLTFLQPAFAVFVKSGVKGIIEYEPRLFWWWLFIPGFLLMALGLFGTVFRPKVPEQ